MLEVFDSRREHKVDLKGRVSVPDAYRALLLEQGGGPLILTVNPKLARRSIMVWPPEVWTKLMAYILKKSPSDKGREYLETKVTSTKKSCAVDANGRIVIPQELRVFAGIDDLALFIGRTDRFEIWSPKRFARFEAQYELDFELQSELATFGV